MQLVNNQPSPYGRKVIIALQEKQLPYETVQDIPWVEETIVPHYLTRAPCSQISSVFVSRFGRKQQCRSIAECC